MGVSKRWVKMSGRETQARQRYLTGQRAVFLSLFLRRFSCPYDASRQSAGGNGSGAGEPHLARTAASSSNRCLTLLHGFRELTAPV